MVLKSPASPYYTPRLSAALQGLPSTSSSSSSSTRNSNPNALSNIPILVTAFLAILATGGPTYSFGVYAGTLKHTLELNQSQLETLGASSFAAGFISWIPGLAVDAWGPKKALLLGGSLQSIGLMLYWFVTRFHDHIYLPIGSPYILPTLSGLSVLIFTSNNLVIGGVFKGIVITCGLGTKGKAVGAAKAYLGLGAGVFAALFRTFLGDSTFAVSDLDFLAMCSGCVLVGIVLPAAFALPTAHQMEKKGTKDESTDLHYTIVYAGLFTLALVVVGTSVLDLIPTTSNTEEDGAEGDIPPPIFPRWLHGIFLLAVWVGPIVSLFFVPTRSAKERKILHHQQSAFRQKVRQQAEGLAAGHSETMRLIRPSDKALSMDFGGTSSIRSQTYDPTKTTTDTDKNSKNGIQETPQPIPDLTLPQMLQTLEAWLFLIASTILVGSGTMLTINMGQLVQSQGYSSNTATASLALFSVAQALARVTAGSVSESALTWTTWTIFGIEGVPRPAFLVLSCAFAVVGHGILAIGSSSLSFFVVGIVLTGFSFGALWPLMVLVIGDLFGTINHGANYMFADGFTCAVGTLSIAKFLTQFIYEAQIEQTNDGATLEDATAVACFGDDCFRRTHIIISGLCLGSLIACTALLYMTRTSYGSLL